jgi:CheY-like chemotaxis protein
MLQISVTDTGIGINKEDKKDIFKAFTQGNTPEEHKKNGFGLGLTISKKLAELLGGNLTLESELGKGSTFFLKIPAKFSNKPLTITKPFEKEIIYKLKAIVVDDDTSMQQLLIDLLKQYGIECYVFGNAQKALDTLPNIHIDFVLTDIQLPKMNGIHFMEILKKHDSYKDQPIIAMTGRSNLSIEDYIDNGFSAVLIKPFNTSKLERVLKQFFGSTLIKTNKTSLNDEENKLTGFSIVSLGSFYNNDIAAIKKTLAIFLEDTKNNIQLLRQAKKDNDITTINNLSHKMLSMFKQLEVKMVVPFLESMETSQNIDDSLFNDFENAMNDFLKSLTDFIN